MPEENHARQYLPISDWLLKYEKTWFRADVIAGLTTAAVVIPKAMAYATIAGLPVQVGLYTALIPMAVYALTGSSRPLSVSTTTTIAVLTGTELSLVAGNGDSGALVTACATLTLMVGAILLAASLLRLGFVANFISEPVLIGFKAGIGVVIVLDQLPKILGIHFPRGPFFHNVLSVIRGIPEASSATVAVGITMIVLLVVMERFLPRAPAPLIAVAAGIVGARFLQLQTHGVELVGYIPKGLPSITRPDFSLAEALWAPALGIALMSFTETIAAGRAFADSKEPPPRANQELFATGLANVAGALLGSMPAGGGTTQTAVNRLGGARSQFAEVISAALALATIVFLAPLLGLMPQATLAAVVIVYSIGLIKPAEFRAILLIRRTEFSWALTAFAGVVLLGTLKGILVAIVLSLVALAAQVADPPVYVLGRKPGTGVFRPISKEHPEDETFPGLLLLRVEGRIFFANAGHIAQKIRSLASGVNPKVVAIDFSGVPDLEYTALKSLIEGEKRQRELGVSLWLVGLNPRVLAMIQKSPLGEILGRERMQFSVEIAVEKYQAMRRIA
ncbi:MAG TPA: SulP family inorganic anion transporter [Dongiaceae bacterium]|nr:SulP family inorganic anion transporter [Dongiaceae bacterium]